eukprot:4284114-Pyramimonas_sp.AAC.1
MGGNYAARPRAQPSCWELGRATHWAAAMLAAGAREPFAELPRGPRPNINGSCKATSARRMRRCTSAQERPGEAAYSEHVSHAADACKHAAYGDVALRGASACEPTPRA